MIPLYISNYRIPNFTLLHVFESVLAYMLITLLLVYAAVCLYGVYVEWQSFREYKKMYDAAPIFFPVDCGVSPTGDFFTCLFQSEKDVPKIFSRIRIQTGESLTLYRVKGVERFSTLGPEGAIHTPKTNLVVCEKINPIILKVLKADLSGAQSAQAFSKS